MITDFANADHVAAATAILKGLAAHPPNRPGFLVHTSGTGSLLFTDIRSGTFGEASEKIYDDLEGVKELTSLPDDAPHVHVDRIVLNASTEHGDHVKTAVVAPPCIYGQGRGPANQTSHQVPALCKATLQRGKGVQVGKGKTYWPNVHVHDLSQLYLLLVEEAAAGGSTAEWNDKPAVWGSEGYYFCENGEHVWGEVSKAVAVEAKKQGLIKTEEVDSLTKEEADGYSPWGSALWGANSRARAKRASAALRWKPTAAKLEDTISETLQEQAKLSGNIPGHAKIAAGDA